VHPAPAEPLAPEVTATVPLGPSHQEIHPGAIAVGEGAVWVLAYFSDETPHQRLLRIDPATNEVVAEIPLPESTAGEVAVGFGSVWVTLYQQGEGSSLGRIDPGTNELVAEIPGVGQQVAIWEGSVWAIDTREGAAEGSVAQVDSVTGEVTASVPLPIVHPPVFDLVAGEGAVWAWTLDDAGDIDSAEATPNLFRIDPATREVRAIDVDTAGLRQIVVGGGYVWVAGAPNEDPGQDAQRFGVLRFDPATGDPVGEPILDASSVPLDYGEGGVWLLREDLRKGLCRLNEDTLEVDACTPEVSFADLYDEAAAIDAETGTIWVSNSENTVTRIDLRADGAEETSACPIEVRYAIAEPVDDPAKARLVLEDNTSVVSALDGVVSSVEASEESGWAEVAVRSPDVVLTYRFYLDSARGALPRAGAEVASGDVIGGAHEFLRIEAQAAAGSESYDVPAMLRTWGCREGLPQTDVLRARLLDGSMWELKLARPIEVVGAQGAGTYGDLMVDGEVVAGASRIGERPDFNRPFEPGFDPPVLIEQFALPDGRRAEHWNMAPSHENDTFDYVLWVEGPGEDMYFYSAQPIADAELVVHSLRMMEVNGRIDAIWFASERVDVVKLQAVFFLIDPQAPMKGPEVRLDGACRVGHDPGADCDDARLEVPVFTPGTELALRGATVKMVAG
jgi:hypothetical protein